MEKTFVEKLGSQLTVSHRLRKYYTGVLTVDWRIYRTILNLRPIEIFVLQISLLAKGVRTVWSNFSRRDQTRTANVKTKYS